MSDITIEYGTAAYSAEKQKLADFILMFGDLSTQQIDFIASKAKFTTLLKDEYFSKAGKIPTQVSFLLNGIFRLSYYDNDGEEITNYFIEGNQFIADYQNFEANLPSTDNLQAVTDCELLLFAKKDWAEISNAINGWDKITDKMYRKCLIETIEKRSPLVAEDATTRYLLFLKKFPSLANRIPLSYIASYLGITQQSLSRIRKNIGRRQ
ncbi:Crp/Fnr family transcriptional regulator [Pedobacter psychrodurus]|uniref:Crp/Fnr family transcriptional regulator n=1 Tax=Pedobacter psychrodurus TaxID=2530456 RepID=A0A4R0Q6C1_9SPHI|nr:Crp/Fnr family transcriptional regulator [Pedobacter psychrodurus]TCD28729.1 Crp/Fnr family transcriptional regulator [Pedobacter psychrodurus]